MKSHLVITSTLLALAASFVPLHAQLLITEINSNGTGGDFWELTNVGASPVDLSNYKWNDSARTATGAIAIPAGTSIAAGESIVFNVTGTAATFRTAWGISNAVQVLSSGGNPGLGQNDAITLYNAANVEVLYLSYAANGFTRSSGSGAAGGHAGASAGGLAAVSMVLDPGFGTSTPRYTAAVVGTFGAFAHTTDSATIGSPGVSGLTVAPPAVTLTVSATPSSFSESAVNPASSGTVTRTGATTSALVVTLSSGDTTEATVPASVTIPIGSASAPFDITAVDDNFPDGNKTAIITASAAGATSGNTTLTINDDGDVYVQKLLLTEVLSQQAASGVNDFWELTNISAGPVSLEGYSWHDNGRSASAAQPYKLPAGTSIAAGESVIFTQLSPAAFRTWWNIPNSVQVFQSVGAPGLGQNDGVSFFDEGQNEIFFFNYAAGGFTKSDGNPSTGAHSGPSAGASTETQSAVWDPASGTASPRYTFASVGSLGAFASAASALDIGSPGVTVGVSSVSIASASAVEGDSGTSALVLNVTRTDTSSAFTVDYAVTGGSANASDFSLPAGTLNFTASGAATLPISITVNGDTDPEPDDTVVVTLSNIQNTTGTTIIGTASGTATILNDDNILPTIATQPTSTTLTSGKATTLLVRAGGSPAPRLQWYQGNSGDTSNPVSGATSEVFLTPTLTANTSFWCRATIGANSVDSATATVTIVPGVTSVDLATYVRVGRHNLPHPSRDPAPANNLLAEEASGVAYNWDTDTLFVIGDGGQSITQVTKTGLLIDTMTLALGSSPQGTEFYDPEGITYIGGGQFVFTEERDRQAVKFTYAPGTTLLRSATQTMKLGTTIGNIGLEGVCYDPQTSGFIFVKEASPLGIFQTTIDFNTLTASNGSPTTVNSINLFDPALAGTLDMSDVFAFSNIPSMIGQPQSGNLLIISQESAKIVNIDRSGSVFSSLTLVSDPGNISIQAQTHEGVVMDPTGRLYVVSENGGGTSAFPQVWVFEASNAPNQPPTAVVLNNTVTSLPENTSTASAIKIADIAVTDDGLGTNTLGITGTDASFFEITGNALFLKAGTVLNFLTKPSYTITVQVDDTGVGATPDATLNYTLAITAAPTGTGNLIISEVAPWSSGNSSLASDWFEVTNIGTAAVDITGWKMDDSGPSLATAVPLNGITSIAPGESVIFIELANKTADFINIWFGGVAPAGLQFGTYTGLGVGLSTGGDAVNLFDSGGTIRASVTFGANAPTVPGPYRTFDNSAGLNSATITTLSSVAVNGAYSVTDTVAVATQGTLIGSPGVIAGTTPIITITATDATATEDGNTTGTFRISRTGSLLGPLTANFTVATGAGQATAADFTPAIGTSVVIPASQSFVDITITPVLDFLGEGNETLTLTLFDTGNYDLGSPDTATVTITDSRFGSWLFANGYNSTGLGNDTDGDGIDDGVEFFFNANPNNGAGFGNFPQIVRNGGALQLHFTRLTDFTGVTGELLVSCDLNTWTSAILGVDYTVLSSTPSGDTTSFTYGLPGSGPSAPGVSPAYTTTNTTAPFAKGASLGGVRVVNEGLVGVGRISGEALDVFGETQGAASGLFISAWAWNGSQFSGKFNVLPDRGYNSGSTFSNYAARLHEVDFTFVPYYGVGPVAQGQIVPTYNNVTTRFTYLDGATTKFTSGLNPTGNGTLFGQTVGTVTAANGIGGAQESLLSFDAEAVHLFADGSGYVSDEYGTYIARFNASKQITGITQLPESARPHRPVGVLNFDSVTAPTNGRRNNQGLEGISVTPDGTRLFAVMQSALVQDTNGTNQQTRNNTRLFVYDVAGANRETPVLIGQYVVKLPQFNATGSGAVNRTAAQSEIIALNATTFLMLPRDGNGLGTGTTTPISFKSVQLVDFASATNILGSYDAEGDAVSPSGVLASGVNAAASAEVINMLNPTDLAKFGLNTNTNPSNSNTLNEKMEGMALVPDLSTPQGNDFFLFIANDNDFQASDVKMVNAAGALVSFGDGRLNAGITNDAMFYAYRITIDACGKKFFSFAVE
jgi:uncharacterized protein YjiK